MACALPGSNPLYNFSDFTGNTNLLIKRFYFTVTDERLQEYDFKAPECLLVDDTWGLNCADDFSGVVQPADKNRFDHNTILSIIFVASKSFQTKRKCHTRKANKKAASRLFTLSLRFYNYQQVFSWLLHMYIDYEKFFSSQSACIQLASAPF